MNPFLYLLVSVCLCVSVCPSSHPGSLPDKAPQCLKPGDKRGRYAACFPGGLPRGQGSNQQALALPLTLPPAPGRRGPVALVSEVFEQHLGGHILQVRPLPACCSLLPPGGRLGRKALFSPASAPGEPQNWEAGCWGSPFFLLLPRATEALYPGLTHHKQRSRFQNLLQMPCPPPPMPPTLSPHSSPWTASCLP